LTTLLTIETILIAVLILVMFYWRIQTSGRLRALRESSRRILESEQRVQSVLLNLQLELNELKDREPAASVASGPRIQASAEEPPTGAAVPRAAGEGLTVAKRSQALKLLRRGDSPDAIAATLGVPKSHIQLLVKVQGLMQESLTAGRAAATEPLRRYTTA
jgi:hypothetical protein